MHLYCIYHRFNSCSTTPSMMHSSYSPYYNSSINLKLQCYPKYLQSIARIIPRLCELNIRRLVIDGVWMDGTGSVKEQLKEFYLAKFAQKGGWRPNSSPQYFHLVSTKKLMFIQVHFLGRILNRRFGIVVWIES